MRPTPLQAGHEDVQPQATAAAFPSPTAKVKPSPPQTAQVGADTGSAMLITRTLGVEGQVARMKLPEASVAGNAGIGGAASPAAAARGGRAGLRRQRARKTAAPRAAPPSGQPPPPPNNR